MRRSIFVALVVLLLAGCASTAKFDDVAALSPMAVVSVSSNGDVAWYGEKKESSGLLGGLLDKAVDKGGNEDLGALMSRSKALLDDAEQTLITSISNNGNVRLASKDDIFNTNAYKHAKNSNDLYAMADMIQPEGYKFISTRDKDFAAAINRDAGVKSNVFIDFTFNKDMFVGVAKNGKVGVRVSMNVRVINEEGKLIFQKFYFGQSEESIGIVAGVYDPIKLFELFPVAISDVCNQFADEFNI